MKIEDFVKTLIGNERIDVLGFDIEKDKHHPEEKVFVARVALWEEEQYLCPKCGHKCKKHDRLRDVKRWRSLDLSKNKFYIEAANPRCLCPVHGVLKCYVPWAIRDSDYTMAFEARVACAAAKSPTNLVSREYRIKWATVGSCVRRVQESISPAENKNRRIKRIAIDETSYRKGYKYITTVQDLETGEIIWAFDGYGDSVLELFFLSLTAGQCAEIEFVVADGAKWITRQVEKYCPNATRCVDPFHVVGWATDALDSVRKRLLDDAKKNALRS